MRIQHAQQRVADFGELVVQPLLRPRREERHTLQQTFDVRIVHRIRRQAQPSRHLGMRIGERARQAAQRIEFPVVIGQQLVGHRLQAIQRVEHDIGRRGVHRRVEDNRFGRRLGPQQRFDAQLQGCPQQ